MSVLVTGAAGFIGSHLCDALLLRGTEVVGLDVFDDAYPRSVKESNLRRARDHTSFQLVEGDIRDQELLEGLPEFTSVIHLAARVGVRPSIEQPGLYSDVNVMGTTRLLKLASDRRIGAFVFASSSSVYGNNDKVPFEETDPVDRPISPYAATKRAGELLCHSSTHLDGLATLCLRFFTAYGPRQRPDLAIHKFARLMAEGRPIPLFGDGSTSRDYTYVDDIVRGVVNALDWANRNPATHEVVNLGGGRAVRLTDMVGLLADVMEVSPDIRFVPPHPGDVERTFADVTKARTLLGYEPEVDFPEGVGRFVEWFRDGPWAHRAGT